METAEEVLMCLTCGDKGYTNAFVYCVKCLGFVIHRYCLDVVPESLDELVQWFCDDCKPPLLYHDTSPLKHDPLQSQKEDLKDSALVKKTHPNKTRKKKAVKKRKIASLVASRKDDECVSSPKQINRPVVLGLQRRKDESLRIQGTVATSLQHVKEALVTSSSGANQITPQSAELDNACFLMKANVKRKRDTIRVAAKRLMHEVDKPTEHSSCESSCTDVTSMNEEDATHAEEGPKSGPDHDKLVSNSSSTEKELNKMSKELNPGDYTSQSAHLESAMQYIYGQSARPIEEPIWRGSFNIVQSDYDIFEGFVGHTSSKACHKVWEVATTLPSMLTLEMNSRAHLWPKSFLVSMPSDDNIGLYFFPEDTKIEREFEQLVSKMIDEDLAMKATAKNAELLIFTSKVLPQECWRFKGNFYLWGVFKNNKNDVSVPNQSNNHGSQADSVEKELRKRVKTVESHSPQSPLCNYR